jgi:antitoxin component of RelBE/YafQ-DinJ toxin-antitoxin module
MKGDGAMAEATMENISVRVPASEKTLFQQIAQRNGTDTAAAIRAFVHAFNVEGGYPFDTAQYYPIDEDEEAEIAALKAQVKAGAVKGFSSHAELRKSAAD